MSRWSSKTAAAFGSLQVDAVAPHPVSTDVAVLSSSLEGNTWNSNIAVFSARVNPWQLVSNTVLQDTAAALAWSSDGHSLLVGSDSGDLIVLRSAASSAKDSSLRLLASLRFHDDAVSCVAATPTQPAIIATCSWDMRCVFRSHDTCTSTSFVSSS
jgi:WD40 repeat protein